MLKLKNARQMDMIRVSCKMLARLFRILERSVAVGISTKELDTIAQDFIRKEGGKPAFLGYLDYPAALCTSVNHEVIHGIPSDYRLCDGDVVSLDCGINLDGHFSDMAMTFPVGTITKEASKLLSVTRESLFMGIEQAVFGKRIHDVSRAIFNHARSHGYGVVKDYCGHGVGFSPHEDPQIPNYISSGPNPRIQPGMVLAIEPMINLGTGMVDVLDDDWTVVTRDGSISAHFEHTIAIFEDHTEILTELDD